MNKILTYEDSAALKRYHQLLRSIKNDCWYREKEDALLKWSSILSSIDSLCLNPNSLVDLGCGQSNLSLVVDKMLDGNLSRIYLLDVEPPHEIFVENQKCVYLQGNILQTASSLQDQCADLVIDSCAVTHFLSTCVCSKNDGIFETGKILSRILKPGGYFVSASDVLSFENDEICGEFISARNLIRLYESHGLRLVKEFEYSYDSALLLDDVVAGHGRGLAVGSFVFQKPA